MARERMDVLELLRKEAVPSSTSFRFAVGSGIASPFEQRALKALATPSRRQKRSRRRDHKGAMADPMTPGMRSLAAPWSKLQAHHPLKSS